ncbi:carbohydrate esterase family 1 protein [Xylariaceae sp. FL0662B]|nr:carbohydrate esterase family 1 protein [Xylariaceae sp. FL0662B]
MHPTMLFSSLAALFLSSQSYAALTQVADWGENPTNLQMAVYLPSTLAENPAIVVALHYCGGTGAAYYQMANYDTYADAGGFIVIYPTTNKDSNCWDVASDATLTNNGGGDSTGLVNMVKYLITKYNADPTKVYATGSSSGCMMTNVLLAVYPDVFAAGSCYSGVAAGCLAGSPGSSPISADQTCANGQNIHTPEEWAELAKAMYPGFSGSYPRMQTLHGEADNFVHYENLAEQLKEWSALLGVEFTKNVTDTPQSGYTQIVYGDGTKLVGYSARGVGHTVPVHPELDMTWFGLT